MGASSFPPCLHPQSTSSRGAAMLQTHGDLHVPPGADAGTALEPCWDWCAGLLLVCAPPATELPLWTHFLAFSIESEVYVDARHMVCC